MSSTDHPSPETLLTAPEVAALLRVSVRQVQCLAKAGEVPGFRVGRQWRFRRSQLDAWLERKSTPPSRPAPLPPPPGDSPYEQMLRLKKPSRRASSSGHPLLPEV